MKRFLLIGSVIAALGIAPGLALASPSYLGLTQTTTMTVQTNVIPAVTVTASVVDFGTIISGESADAYGTVAVTATAGLAYEIAMNGGSNQYLGLRSLRSPAGDFISYKLFQDPQHSIEWGDNNINYPAPPLSGLTGNGGAQVYFVYAHYDAPKSLPANVYTDTVLVSVNY